MKKAALMKTLRAITREHNAKLQLVRQGKHEMWECRGYRFPVPRHREISNNTARIIINGLRNHLEGIR